jgi:hypothetical protein
MAHAYAQCTHLGYTCRKTHLFTSSADRTLRRPTQPSSRISVHAICNAETNAQAVASSHRTRHHPAKRLPKAYSRSPEHAHAQALRELKNDVELLPRRINCLYRSVHDDVATKQEAMESGHVQLDEARTASETTLRQELRE